jgi:hypothetical protein
MSRGFDSYKDRYTKLVNDSIAFSGLTVDLFTWAQAGHLIELAARSLGDLRTVQGPMEECGCAGLGVGLATSESRHVRAARGLARS